MTGTDTNWTVITGSTGGIGRELVKILAAQGSALILVNRSDTKAKAQHHEIRKAYPALDIERVTADLMDTGQIAQAAATINDLTGRIDALYNNSGV